MVLGAIGTLTRAASKARLDRFDKRTAAGRLLHDARRDFEAHLGGVEEISATECALIGRLAMRTLVIALVDVSPLFRGGGDRLLLPDQPSTGCGQSWPRQPLLAQMRPRVAPNGPKSRPAMRPVSSDTPGVPFANEPARARKGGSPEGRQRCRR